jgi:N-acetyl-gamma-glutamyl-phosphate reductase
MQKICSLENLPIFSPIVAPFYSGMEVSVPLFGSDLNCSFEELKKFYTNYYKDGLVKCCLDDCEGGFLSSTAFSGKDTMEISVTGNSERIVLVSRFDNLGKGASGAAIQNMNILLGVPENTGLSI